MVETSKRQKAVEVFYYNRTVHFLSDKKHSTITTMITLIHLDIGRTVYHLVIHTQSNKIHKVILMSKFIQHLY